MWFFHSGPVNGFRNSVLELKMKLLSYILQVTLCFEEGEQDLKILQVSNANATTSENKNSIERNWSLAFCCYN